MSLDAWITWRIHVKIHVSYQGFSNVACDWLEAVLPNNQRPSCLGIPADWFTWKFVYNPCRRWLIYMHMYIFVLTAILFWTFRMGKTCLSFFKSTDDLAAATIDSSLWAGFWISDMFMSLYGFIDGGSNSPRRNRTYNGCLIFSLISFSAMKAHN